MLRNLRRVLCLCYPSSPTRKRCHGHAITCAKSRFCACAISCLTSIRVPGWRWLKSRPRLLKTLLFFLVATLLFVSLHYKILPQSMGYYNEECFMAEERRERMRFVLRHVIEFMNSENATYWLDFGTLLGVIREGDIMAHDGDLDVSRLSDDMDKDRSMMERFEAKMKPLDIQGSTMQAKYKDVTVDLFRWHTHNISGRPVLQKWYPFVPKFNLGEVISDFLFPPDVPADVLFPLRQVSLFGVYASIPRRTLDFLKIKYPLTWFMSFPYKWKCWT